MTWSSSRSRPTTGQIRPAAARAVRSIPHSSSIGVDGVLVGRGSGRNRGRNAVGCVRAGLARCRRSLQACSARHACVTAGPVGRQYAIAVRDGLGRRVRLAGRRRLYEPGPLDHRADEMPRVDAPLPSRSHGADGHCEDLGGLDRNPRCPLIELRASTGADLGDVQAWLDRPGQEWPRTGRQEPVVQSGDVMSTEAGELLDPRKERLGSTRSPDHGSAGAGLAHGAGS